MADSRLRVSTKNMYYSSDSNGESASDFDSDDSILDKDYVNRDDSASSSSSEEGQGPQKRRAISRKDLPTPEKVPKSRWRKRNIEKAKMNKTRRNVGSSYRNRKGEIVGPRIMGPPCTCKRKCRTLLQGSEEIIFNTFWDLGDYQKQNTYLFHNMKTFPKKRTYPKKVKRAVSRRKYSVNYFVKVNGIDVQICKEEFLSLHGLQNSRKRLQLLLVQMDQGASTPKQDGRGKHKNHPKKVSEGDCQGVRDHINSIPKYASHYSRKRNPNKVYINHDLSIQSLYLDYYKPWCEERNTRPVSQDKYRRIFCTEYNIGFKLPMTDTCKTCDSIDIKIQENKENEEILRTLRFELELHQRRAQAMQDNMKTEVASAKVNKNTCIISFDLQQALPVPNLSTGPAFYLRKAWVYNLGLHDCITDSGFMYMWPENVAKRGSDEIASIVYNHFKNNKPSAEHLILYTDNCGGQNKNWVLICLWQHLVREAVFKSIEHRFLVVGHTYLPSDRDFALIEKYKRKMSAAYDPSDWYTAVKKCKRKNPFVVKVMTREDFFSFKFLESAIIKKKLTDDKLSVSFSKICCVRFEENNPNIMKIKHCLNESFKNVNIGRKGLRRVVLSDSLTLKYTEPVPLNEKKLKNLALLLPYIPQVKHGYYEELGVKDVASKNIDIAEDNPEILDDIDVLSDDDTHDANLED